MSAFLGESSVSVIIPVFNGERFIADAVDSILDQSIEAHEIIVIDDGSTDRTGIIVDRYSDRVRVISSARAGSWAARNQGAREATGEVLVFQDADDIAHPLRIEHQIAELNSSNSPALVFGMMTEFFDEDGAIITHSEDLISGVCPGTLALKRETFLRIGEFPTDSELSSFIDWFMRVNDMGFSHRVIATAVLARRVHGANTTKVSEEELGKTYLRTIRAGIERRRANV